MPMQSDQYVKVVLTVIAACLVWICVLGVDVGTPGVYVYNWDEAPDPGPDGTQDVNIVGIEIGKDLSRFGGISATDLPVEVKNWPMAMEFPPVR
jgi:hypothetical protein